MRLRAERLSWIVGSATALFYLCFHSAYYNFDGVACAIAVELGDWAHLVHGNHLAYGIVGLVFHRLWRLLGYAGPAMLPLQTLDSLLGGLGVALFHSMLRKLKFSASIALGAAAALALSQCYWFWSLEAQVYLLGMVFVFLAATEALCERPRWGLLGLWHAGAILGHVGHAMLLPVVAYRLWKTRAGVKGASAYAVSSAGALCAAYAAAAVFCVRPASFDELRKWLLGSAALTVERSFTWQGGYSLHGLSDWLETSLRLMVDRAGPAGLGFLLAAAPLAAAAFAVWKCRRGPRAGLVAACLIWIASYALLFSSWEPFLDVYRISDLVPLWLLAAVTLESMPAREGRIALTAWAAGAGLFNATQSILPRADAASNAPYQDALFVAKTAPENAWIVVTARGQVYVPYFAHRKPLNMRYFASDWGINSNALNQRLDEFAVQNQPVFITDQVLAEGPWRGAFENYGLVQENEEVGRKLYRVRRKGSPKAARRRN
ncbi:MAG: hypothetical protein HY077_18060 [Elusimicrobia bacterium]|nr:hypothetical protein [Elusimicrobiota bacterium]